MSPGSGAPAGGRFPLTWISDSSVMTWLLARVRQSWGEEAYTTKEGEHCPVGRSFLIQFNKGSNPPSPLDTASVPSQMFGVGTGGIQLVKLPWELPSPTGNGEAAPVDRQLGLVLEGT